MIENKRNACAKERQERKRDGKPLEGRELRDLGQRLAGSVAKKEGGNPAPRATQIILKTQELGKKDFVSP
jgi:hypothetical protein